MKIVLKELMNRVGLPTGRLIYVLTTYAGFGVSAVALHRASTPHSNAGGPQAGAALPGMVPPTPTPQERLESLGGVLKKCAFGVSRQVWLKDANHKSTRSTRVCLLSCLTLSLIFLIKK